jgi:hypothetical protein
VVRTLRSYDGTTKVGLLSLDVELALIGRILAGTQGFRRTISGRSLAASVCGAPGEA